MNKIFIANGSEWFRTILGTTVFWLLLVGLFAASSHLDLLRQGMESRFWDRAMVWGLGFASWLVLLPLLYLFSKSETLNAKGLVRQSAGIAAAFMAGFSTLLIYSLFIYVPVVGSTPKEFLATTRLVDWIWDIILFVTVYLAGRLAGMKVNIGAAEKELQIAVRSSGKLELVPVRDIVAGSAQGNYISLICHGRDYLHRATLSDLLSDLSDEGFLRTHRSHFVRPDQIASIRSSDGHVRDVCLKNGRRIPVSKSYEKVIKATVEAY